MSLLRCPTQLVQAAQPQGMILTGGVDKTSGVTRNGAELIGCRRSNHFFNALSGWILTTFRAGLALKTVSSFVNGLIPCGEFIQPINSAYESRAFRHTSRSGFGRDWQRISTPSLGADISARISESQIACKSILSRNLIERVSLLELSSELKNFLVDLLCPWIRRDPIRNLTHGVSSLSSLGR